MLSGLAMKTRDPPRPLETFAPPPLLPSSLHPLLELMLLLLPKEEEHLEGLDASMPSLRRFVCALSLSRVFPPNNTKGSPKFCRCSNTIRLISGFAGPQQGGRGGLSLCWALCVFDYKTTLCSAHPIGAKSANFKWHLALRCVALCCSDLVCCGLCWLCCN